MEHQIIKNEYKEKKEERKLCLSGYEGPTRFRVWTQIWDVCRPQCYETWKEKLLRASMQLSGIILIVF